MRVIKPEWMHHDGDQILSLDIDPIGMRIATAGRGESAGKICIWDIGNVKKIVVDGGSFEKYASRAKLSDLEEHTGCVNCVRWSKNGKLLASGGDDCNIIIWCIKKMQTYTNDKALKNREMWKPQHTLQGHTGDILDIAWSNCGKFLASASIDNLICIWDVKNFPNMLRKLVGHQSFVKGLAWDPVGEFLASQSDDKTLMIWSTLNFVGDNTNVISPTAVIKKPFKKATSMTQFLRLAWSTDGQFILSAHAANNTAPVAKIIERGSWTSQKDCVGHRAAISSVAFNPNIYQQSSTLNDTNRNNNNNNNKTKNGEADDISVVCALGSRDGTLSIWKFPQKRPFVVVHNLFVSAIADMSWNSAGNMLLVSSVEGNLSFITFDPKRDFGPNVLNSNQIAEYHKKHYGLSIQTAYQIPNIPMSVDFVGSVVTQANSVNVVTNSSPITNSSSVTNSASISNSTSLSNSASEKNKLSCLKNNVSPVKNNVSPVQNKILPVQNNPPPTNEPLMEEETVQISQENKVKIVEYAAPKQKETILKDGRRRITPILIAAPIEDSPIVIRDNMREDIIQIDNEEDVVNTTSKKFKKKVVHFEDNSESFPDKSNRISIMHKRNSNELSSDSNSASIIGVFSKRLSVSGSTLVKTPPMANQHEFTIEIDKVLFNVSIKNESVNQKIKSYELRCRKNNQPYWSSLLMGRVVFIKYCEKMIVCFTEDNRLHVFNYCGWRIFPQIVIPDNVIGLFISSLRYISVVTTFGEIMTWDVPTQKLLHKNIYVPMDRMEADNTLKGVKSIDIHPETELPIVILNDYTTYLYNDQLAAWLPLTDKLCYFASCFPSLAAGFISIIDENPFSNVQKFYEARNVMNDQFTDNSAAGCTSFLLNQLDVFITLKLKQPFYDTFIILIQFLTEHNKEQTITSLCEHLTNSTMSRNDIIFNNVGYSAVFLMERLLQIIKTNIKMQNLYLKFQSLL